MKRKPAKSLTALSCWLGAGALVLWLCSMVLVTVVTAQYLYSIAYEEYFQFLQETDSYVTQDRSDRLGLNESSFWMALARGKNDAYSPRLAFDSLQFVRDLTFNIRTAMVITDAVCRMVPGVLAETASFEDESHWSGVLEYPQYTRPEVWRDMPVPQVLLSGNHENIQKWRRLQALYLTRERRPDLFEQLELDKKEKKLLSILDAALADEDLQKNL